MTEVSETLGSQKTAHYGSGRIQTIANDGFVVLSGGRLVQAKRAIGCLIEPVIDDHVAMFHDGVDSYIISILSRKKNTALHLDFERSVDIGVKNGNITISSPQDIDIATAGRLKLLSTNQVQQSIKHEVFTTALRVSTSEVELACQKVSAGIRQAIISMGTLVQTVKNSFSHIKETEQSICQNRIVDVKQSLQQHSKNAIVTADDDIKVDAARIHMG